MGTTAGKCEANFFSKKLLYNHKLSPIAVEVFSETSEFCIMLASLIC